MDESHVVDRSFRHTTIKADYLGGAQVHLVINKSSTDKGNGPWALTVDEAPDADGMGAGPSPVPLAMAALAS